MAGDGAEESLIRRIDASSKTFIRTWQALSPDVRKEAQRAIGMLVLVDVRTPPARLHLHMLTGRTVPAVLDPKRRVKVYTLHLTSNDAWKASFTLDKQP